MVMLPDSIPRIEINAAKVAYAYETVDMIQAHVFLAECAYKRAIATIRPLEVRMMRARVVLQRAQTALQDLCVDHQPRVQLDCRGYLPISSDATPFTFTSFPPNSRCTGD
jgi:hypothetical protein